MSALQRLPYWAALIVIAAGTASGVYVAVRTANYLWIPVTLVVVGVFAVAFLREYAKLPGPPETDPFRLPTPVIPNEPSAAPTASPTSAAATETLDAEAGGPVEQDSFDPDYDPVAEADRIESTKAPPTRPVDGTPPEP